MRRKLHPADIAEAAIVSQAVRYEISLFVDRRFVTASAPTLGEAREAAAGLLAQHPTSRRPLIYGIDADRRRGLVTETAQEATNMPNTETTNQAPAKAAPKAAKAPKAAAGNGKAPLGKWAAILAAARAGKLPAAPDFSAATHERFRPKLAEVIAMVKRRDIKGLKAWRYEGFMSTSPKAIMRYRDLAIIAIEAQWARR